MNRLIWGFCLSLFFSCFCFAQGDQYTLFPGDRITVLVHDQADIQSTQEVNKDGSIRLKYIGVIQVAGLSTRAAESAIETQFVEQRYLRAPDVSLQIVNYSSKPVVVRGAVVRPGLVELDRHPQGLDINQVIAMAGGFRDVAKQSAIRVIREDSKGKAQVFEVDLSGKVKKKNNSDFERFIVLPDDIIEVDETTF